MQNDIYQIKKVLKTAGREFSYYSLAEMQKQGYEIEKMPFSIRILLENVLRNFDDFAITKENIETILNWKPEASDKDIPFKPARVLMQDFTGVPAVVDIASLRAEAARRGKNPDAINPLIPVDLVVDHSVQVDYFGTEYSYQRNMDEEYKRNSDSAFDVKVGGAELKAELISYCTNSIAVRFGFLHQPVESLGASAIIDHFDDLIPALAQIR